MESSPLIVCVGCPLVLACSLVLAGADWLGCATKAAPLAAGWLASAANVSLPFERSARATQLSLLLPLDQFHAPPPITTGLLAMATLPLLLTPMLPLAMKLGANPKLLPPDQFHRPPPITTGLLAIATLPL